MHSLATRAPAPLAALATIVALALCAAFAVGRETGRADDLAAAVRAATLADVQARLALAPAADHAPAWLAGMDAAPAVEPTAQPMGETGASEHRCADVPPAALPEGVRRWCGDIDAAADRWGLDPRALAILVSVECPWGDPECGSHAGARGLAQIIPATARTLAAETGLPCADGPTGVNTDPAVNLACGAAYFVQGLRAAATIWRAGDEAQHIGAAGIGYNAGNGRIPAAVAHWQAGGHVCDAPVPAESRRWCRQAVDGWQLLTASPAPLDGALGIAHRPRP